MLTCRFVKELKFGSNNLILRVSDVSEAQLCNFRKITEGAETRMKLRVFNNKLKILIFSP